MKRAAQYLRMSTDHQRYSLGNQAAGIACFALAENYDIVRTYEDAGKSGLTLHGRPGLKRLLADVLSGDADFDAVLVLDVSRWGRFQDPDQAAHYEFLCREAGVAVIYCAEGFANDGAPASTIVKHLKRVMAAEYSRELSDRIRSAKRRQMTSGCLLGAPPPYGIRRELRDPDGKPVCILEKGEQKAVRSWRTYLVRGPKHEVRTTRWIFRMFDQQGLAMGEIAQRLNRRKIPSSTDNPWDGTKVRAVLRNELAIGYWVWGKTSVPLKGRRVDRPQTEWVRVKVMAPIVTRAVFDRVAARLDAGVRGEQLTRAEMLTRLKRLRTERGGLTRRAIDACAYTPRAETYVRAFGTLAEAFRVIGFSPDTASRWKLKGLRIATLEEVTAALRALYEAHGYLSHHLIRDAETLPSPSAVSQRYGSLRAAYAAAGYTVSRSEIQRAGWRRRMERLEPVPAASGPGLPGAPSAGT